MYESLILEARQNREILTFPKLNGSECFTDDSTFSHLVRACPTLHQHQHSLFRVLTRLVQALLARLLLVITIGIGSAMVRTGVGLLLGTLIYGGLLVMFMFLLAQLLPVFYGFVAQAL
jgi:hypothetical protein